MSIYPVKLSEWFPLGDEMHEYAYSMISSYRCLSCDKKLRWKSAIAHHSLPWGYGDIWCSWKCCDSGKIARFDKRRWRRFRRKTGDSYKVNVREPNLPNNQDHGFLFAKSDK